MSAQALLARLRFCILYIVWPIAAGCSPLVANAAEITFGQGFAQIPGIAWIAVLGLSTLAGVTALLLRISAQINEGPDGATAKPMKDARIFAAAHMCGSWLAGVVVFLLALHGAWPDFLVGAAIILASFGGAKTLELLTERFFNKVLK